MLQGETWLSQLRMTLDRLPKTAAKWWYAATLGEIEGGVSERPAATCYPPG
jgi:hypothetical protein